MSHTTICVTGRDGVVYHGRHFPHASRSTWFIWTTLWRQFLSSDWPILSGPHGMEPLWRLDKDFRLSREDRIALVSTLDYAMIRRSECRWVAHAFDAFTAAYERRQHYRSLTNLPAQAHYLRELADHPDVYDVCWQHTSTAGNIWHIPEPEDRPYNVRLDCSHWYVFERYPELKPGSPPTV